MMVSFGTSELFRVERLGTAGAVIFKRTLGEPVELVAAFRKSGTPSGIAISVEHFKKLIGKPVPASRQR
jgi:hypothetical protein